MKVTSQSGDALDIVAYELSTHGSCEGNLDCGARIDSTASARRADQSCLGRACAASARHALRAAPRRRAIARAPRRDHRRAPPNRRSFRKRSAPRLRRIGPAARAVRRRATATIGRPAASASSATVGAPSMRDGNHERIGGGEQRQLVGAVDVAARSARDGHFAFGAFHERRALRAIAGDEQRGAARQRVDGAIGAFVVDRAGRGTRPRSRRRRAAPAPRRAPSGVVAARDRRHVDRHRHHAPRRAVDAQRLGDVDQIGAPRQPPHQRAPARQRRQQAHVGAVRDRQVPRRPRTRRPPPPDGTSQCDTTASQPRARRRASINRWALNAAASAQRRRAPAPRAPRRDRTAAAPRPAHTTSTSPTFAASQRDESGDERARRIVGVARIRRGQDADAHSTPPPPAAPPPPAPTSIGAARLATSRRSHERSSTNDIGYTTVDSRIPERQWAP